MTAFCTRCKRSVPMPAPQSVTLKNGRPAARDQCPHCSTPTFRLMKRTHGR